jgi:hypothetical protein
MHNLINSLIILQCGLHGLMTELNKYSFAKKDHSASLG